MRFPACRWTFDLAEGKRRHVHARRCDRRIRTFARRAVTQNGRAPSAPNPSALCKVADKMDSARSNPSLARSAKTIRLNTPYTFTPTDRLRRFEWSSDTALAKPPADFPNFTAIPTSLHIFSYENRTFATPRFGADQNSGSPFVFFDDKANTTIISPAANFMTATSAWRRDQQCLQWVRSDARESPRGI